MQFAEAERNNFKSRTTIQSDGAELQLSLMDMDGRFTNEQKLERARKAMTAQAQRKLDMIGKISKALGMDVVVHDYMRGSNGYFGEDGKMYAVPFVWGSTAIAYNTELMSEAPNSLKCLFDEQYAGKLTIRDDYNDAIMAAAIVLGQDPTNPNDLDAIKDLLIQQKPLNRTYWQTGDEFSKLFAGGQIDFGMMWSGQAATMKQEGEPIAFVVPEDGAIGWVDNWGIAAGSQHEDLAYAFINYMISKDVQYNWASKGGPAPANQSAAESLDPDYAASCGMDEASLNRLYFMAYQDDATKAQWAELWTDVKAS